MWLENCPLRQTTGGSANWHTPPVWVIWQYLPIIGVRQERIGNKGLKLYTSPFRLGWNHRCDFHWPPVPLLPSSQFPIIEKTKKKLVSGEERQGWPELAVILPALKAKDNPSWRLIKTFHPDPISKSHSLRSPTVTFWMHSVALINLLCFVMLSNSFLFCDKNLDWVEASPGLRRCRLASGALLIWPMNATIGNVPHKLTCMYTWKIVCSMSFTAA